MRSYGVEAAARLCRDFGLTGDDAVRGGFLTAIDPAERVRALSDNRRAVDEAAPWARTLWSWCRADSRPAPGTCAGHGNESRTHWPSWRRTPPSGVCGWPSSPSTRCTPQTAVWSPPWRRHWTSPSVSRQGRWGSRSTRTTSGGTTRLPGRSRVRAPAAASTPSSWPTGPPRCRRSPQRPGPARRRGHRHAGWKGYVEAAGYTGPIEVELFNDALWARDAAGGAGRNGGALRGARGLGPGGKSGGDRATLPRPRLSYCASELLEGDLGGSRGVPAGGENARGSGSRTGPLESFPGPRPRAG